MKKLALTEDWTVVLLGFLIIGLALMGIKIPSPSFGWESTSDLTEKVLTVGNLVKLAQIFVFTYVIALLAASVLGKSVAGTAKGFPIVFILTSFALVLAGNAFLKNWNLEAVIFSLTIGLLLSNFFTLPAWLTETLSTELFVKIGLILLGHYLLSVLAINETMGVNGIIIIAVCIALGLIMSLPTKIYLTILLMQNEQAQHK